MTLDFSTYTSPYRSRHTILHALLWNAVKRFFTSCDREDIYTHVKTLSIRDETLTLKTERPLINAEILHYQKDLIQAVNTSIALAGSHITKLHLR